MRNAIGVLLLLAGCEGGPAVPTPDMGGDPLTAGVKVTPAGCPYSVTTPPETTAPVMDDGSAPIGTPRSLHVSWSGDPATSATIVWVTDVASLGSRVTVSGKAVGGFSFSYPTDLNASDPPSVRVHEVHLCGLTPGTPYSYTLDGGGGGSFATAPAGSGSYKFAVAGDSRGNPAQWGEVLKDAAKSGVAFLLYTGDAVDLGFAQPSWDDWFAAGKGVLPSLPLITAAGNHEGTARHYFAQMALPGNEQWYGFDYGDVHFTVLDDTPRDDASIEGAQRDFLSQELSTSKKKWKLVAHHKAVFSSSMHGSLARLQQAWMPLYDQFSVDAVFNGHDHDYERTKPMKGGQPVAMGGTIYQVNGGGGADLYAAGTSPFTQISKSTYAYSIVEVSPASLTITAYEVANGNATQLDRFTLAK